MTDDDPRFLLAAAVAMKAQQGDDASVTYSIDEMRAFVAGLNRSQRRRLRSLAKDITDNGPVTQQ